MSHLVLLATEAGEATTGPSGASIAVIILLVALAVFAAAYFVVGPGRRRGPKLHGDIPLAMRPYHSDEELETSGLERAMSWATALAAFAAVFLPLYWLIEPARINDKLDQFYEQDVEFGRQEFQANCTTCHGENASGGFAPHPDPEIDAPWPAPALDNIVARYEGTDLLQNLGPDLPSQVAEFMEATIKQGRPGTPMPAWGTAYQGPMNDYQVESIVRYLLSIQTGEAEAEARTYSDADGRTVFVANCARCHGQNAEGRVGPGLTNVFARYGADLDDPDGEGYQEAYEAVRHTILNGRYVPSFVPMPAWEEDLTPEAIEKLMEYLASIQVEEGPAYGQIGGNPEGDQ